MTPSAHEHGQKVGILFGRIAPSYDLLNRLLSGGLDFLWRRSLVQAVEARHTGWILDLAAGTMDVSVALARRHAGARILAFDFCLPMLEEGLSKLGKPVSSAMGAIKPVVADAFCLPLANECVDAVTVAFGLRNMIPRGNVLREVYRVLVPGGSVHVLEFGSAAIPVWFGLYNFYLKYVLPFIGGLVSGDRGAYTYLARTVEEFPRAGDLAGEMEQAGFSGVSWRKMSGGIVYLHSGRKEHP